MTTSINLDKATNADIENAKQGKSDTTKQFLETLKNRNRTASLSLSRSSQSQSLPDNSNSSITKIELTELVKIAGWIENAKLSINKKNYNESALLKLREIKSGNSPHEVKINNFKENDGDNKSWLEKCLNIAENTLQLANNEEKVKIDKIEKDIAYNDSGIDNWTNLINIDKVVSLFTLSKNAHSQPENDYSGSASSWFTQLEIAKNKNDDIWKATDKYQVVTNRGYATRAYDRLKTISELVKKGETDLKNTDTPEKVQQIWNSLAETHPLKNNQSEDQKKLTLGRFKAHALLVKDGVSQDIELANLLVKLLETNYSLDNSGLTKIESDITILKKYQGASETEEEGKSRTKLTEAIIGIDGRKLIDELIIEMEAKKAIIKINISEDEKDEDKEQQPPNDGWKIWQIILGGFLVVAVLGIIVYLIKKNSNEENN